MQNIWDKQNLKFRLTRTNQRGAHPSFVKYQDAKIKKLTNSTINLKYCIIKEYVEIFFYTRINKGGNKKCILKYSALAFNSGNTFTAWVSIQIVAHNPNSESIYSGRKKIVFYYFFL